MFDLTHCGKSGYLNVWMFFGGCRGEWSFTSAQDGSSRWMAVYYVGKGALCMCSCMSNPILPRLRGMQNRTQRCDEAWSPLLTLLYLFPLIPPLPFYHLLSVHSNWAIILPPPPPGPLRTPQSVFRRWFLLPVCFAQSATLHYALQFNTSFVTICCLFIWNHYSN